MKKITFFSYQLKKYLSLNGQEKSNFQNFSTKFYISLDDVKNYLNIFFYEKKNWIFPGQKTACKNVYFSFFKFEKSPFLDGQEKSNFQKFSTKFCRSLEGILDYLNINFCKDILKIGFFLANLRRAYT